MRPGERLEMEPVVLPIGAPRGFGHTYYGKRSFRVEGLDTSYTTTRWLVMFHVPLFPSQSVRIRGDAIIDVLELDILQVLYIYGYFYLVWPGLYYFSSRGKLVDHYEAIAFCAAVVFPFVFRIFGRIVNRGGPAPGRSQQGYRSR
jgi:hypothetical protein